MTGFTLHDTAGLAKTTAVNDHQLNNHISVHDAWECLECKLSSFSFDNPQTPHHYFDWMEAYLRETNHEKWFFLIDYTDCTIHHRAWNNFWLRARRFNYAHSQGSARFDTSAKLRTSIEAFAGASDFLADVFQSRSQALAHIQGLHSQRHKAKQARKPTYDVTQLEKRVFFHPELLRLDLDKSNLCFEHAGDVDTFFGFVEHKIRLTNHRWYLLINYRNFTVAEPALVRWLYRVRRLVNGAALGGARYGMTPLLQSEVRRAAAEEQFDANLFDNRSDAIAALKAIFDPFA